MLPLTGHYILKFVASAVSDKLRGPQILKAGHVTQVTTPFT